MPKYIERHGVEDRRIVSSVGDGQVRVLSSKMPIQRRLDFTFWKTLFMEMFLPIGYPHTVSEDYLDYQIYDTLQAFASSMNGALATDAVLRGVGIGNEVIIRLFHRLFVIMSIL